MYRSQAAIFVLCLDRPDLPRTADLHPLAMTDLPPAYDAAGPSRPTINFPILQELHGKRVVLGISL